MRLQQSCLVLFATLTAGSEFAKRQIAGNETGWNGTSTSTRLSSSLGTAIAAATWTVPAQGSGLSYAEACNSEWALWKSISTLSGTHSLSYSSWTITNYTGVETTVCSPTPSIVGPITPTATWTSSASWSVLDYTGAAPSCELGRDACQSVWSVWDSALWSYQDQYVYTVSLASTPTQIVFGNRVFGTTTQSIANGALADMQPIVLGDATFTATTSQPFKTTQKPSTYYTKSGVGGIHPGYSGYANTLSLSKTLAPNITLASQCSNYSLTRTSTCSPANPCTIYGGNVELLYFETPKNQSGDTCAREPTYNGTYCPYGTLSEPDWETFGALAENPTFRSCELGPHNFSGPVTNAGPYHVESSNTFYKNRAYISLATAYAENDCGRVGGNYNGRILELASTSVYSMCPGYCNSGGGATQAFPMKFADLEPPVPLSAWRCIPCCDHNAGAPPGPQTPAGDFSYINDHTVVGEQSSYFLPVGRTCTNVMFDEGLKPLLVVPPQIRTLDPAWGECVLNLGGLYDPPRKLTQDSTVGQPTLAGQTATPAETPNSNVAPSTAEAPKPTDSGTPSSVEESDQPPASQLEASQTEETVVATPQDPNEQPDDHPAVPGATATQPTAQQPPDSNSNPTPTQGQQPQASPAPEPNPQATGGGSQQDGDPDSPNTPDDDDTDQAEPTNATEAMNELSDSSNDPNSPAFSPDPNNDDPAADPNNNADLTVSLDNLISIIGGLTGSMETDAPFITTNEAAAVVTVSPASEEVDNIAGFIIGAINSGAAIVTGGGQDNAPGATTVGEAQNNDGANDDSANYGELNGSFSYDPTPPRTGPGGWYGGQVVTNEDGSVTTIPAGPAGSRAITNAHGSVAAIPAGSSGYQVITTTNADGGVTTLPAVSAGVQVVTNADGSVTTIPAGPASAQVVTDADGSVTTIKGADSQPHTGGATRSRATGSRGSGSSNDGEESTATGTGQASPATTMTSSSSKRDQPTEALFALLMAVLGLLAAT